MEQLKYIAYLRCDVHKGSNIEFNRQLRHIQNFIKGKGEIIKVFKEVYDGGCPDREELSKAIAFQNLTCNKGALLISMTFEILTQNVLHGCNIIDNVPFRVCEVTDHNEFTLSLLNIMANHRYDSPYYKKTRPFRLPKQPDKTVMFIIQILRPTHTLKQIASELNRMDIKTFHNKQYSATSVLRLLNSVKHLSTS